MWGFQRFRLVLLIHGSREGDIAVNTTQTYFTNQHTFRANLSPLVFEMHSTTLPLIPRPNTVFDILYSSVIGFFLGLNVLDWVSPIIVYQLSKTGLHVWAEKVFRWWNHYWNEWFPGLYREPHSVITYGYDVHGVKGNMYVLVILYDTMIYMN